MTQVVEVPNFGPVEFPDGMSDAEIVAAIKQNGLNYEPKPKPSFISQHILKPLRNTFDIATEVPAALASGLVAQGAANVVGVGKDIFSGQFGQGKGRPDQATLEALTYQPRNPLSRQVLGTLGTALDESKLAGLPVTGAELPALAQAVKQQVPYLTARAGAIGAPTPEQILKSGTDAAKIDINRRALERGITLDPSAVNDSTKNAVYTTIAGKENIMQHARRANEPVVVRIAQQDLGLPPGTAITRDTLNEVRKVAGEPYSEISNIPRFQADAQFVQDLGNINRLEGLSPPVAAIVKSEPVQDFLAALRQPEFNGNDVVTLMKDLRRDANRVLSSVGPVDPAVDAMAQAKKGAAKAIEQLVERNLAAMDEATPGAGFGDLAKRFREGRTLIAKTHTYEQALKSDGTLDAMKLRSLGQKNTSFTGGVKDIADFASAYPDVMGRASKNPVQSSSLNTRGGALAMLGGGIGSAIGGPVGGGIGAGIGVMSTPVVSAFARDRLLNPAYQLKNARIPDFRPLRTSMGYDSLLLPAPVAPTEINPTLRGLLGIKD